jgi:hypothetical protein
MKHRLVDLLSDCQFFRKNIEAKEVFKRLFLIDVLYLCLIKH